MTRPVLHVVRPAAGGIRQHVLELLRRTDEVRFSVRVAAPAEFLRGLPTDVTPADRLMLDIAPRLSPARDLLAAARLAQYARGHGDILLHAHGLRAAFVTALARRLCPFHSVFTAHNLVLGGRLTQIGVRLAGRSADRVIAVSQAVADGLTACGIPTGKIAVIPNGVDTGHFAPQPDRARRPDIHFTVGCVARLSSEKGVDVLLRAAVLLPSVRFLIAGDGPGRAALTASASPNVQWRGRVEDARDVYGASDAIAVPSRQEGQGLVALEAMASGIPLVASRVGGLAEMLTDGANALLVPPDDPSALADALTRLRDDPALRVRLSCSGRALVQDHYDVRRMAEAVQELYTTTFSGSAE